MSESSDESRLGNISTRWSCVQDINRFVLRYANAMNRLLQVIINDEESSREVLQSFLIKVMEKGFGSDIPRSGRFRDYLAKSLRNAAMDHFRKNMPAQADELTLQQLEAKWESVEDQWRQSWTQCLLERAWQQLEHVQYSTPDCRYYDVLRFSVDHRELSSEASAAKLSRLLDRPLTAGAYRQQLSRARTRFAQLLWREIRETLEEPTQEAIDEEIAALGLRTYLDRHR